MDRFDVQFPLEDFLPAPTTAQVTEPARTIPVVAQCDVAVFGGGTAGICAAAAAARQGKSVVLIENCGFLGGMATAGLVNIWHTFYGMDRQTRIMGGLPVELVERLRPLGAVYNADKENETAHWVIDSEQCKFVCDDLVLGSGVKLLLQTRLAGAVRDGRRLTAALVENKSGRGAVKAGVYIDCTGDADLVRFCGIETQLGDGAGRCQAPTLCFRLQHLNIAQTSFNDVVRILRDRPMDYNNGSYPPALWATLWPGCEDEYLLAGTRVLNINTADARDLTRAEVEARYQLRWFLGQVAALPGWEQARLMAMAAQVGPRESHRIIADHQFSREEVLHGTPFADTIARGTYPIDIHTPDAPGITFEHLDGRWHRSLPDGSVETGRWDGQPEDAPKRETLCYNVPYRSLIPRDLDNVLAAGRCMGATHESAGAIRVMVNCMQTGQAAGMAAALAREDVREVAIDRLQEGLTGLGMPL